MKKEVDFFVIVIDLYVGKLEFLIDLEGLLQYHTKYCFEINCTCSNLLDLTVDNKASEKEWYVWVHNLIAQGIEKFPKSARLHYFSAIIYREKLDNKFNSLYAAYSLLESKPTLEQEFAAFRHIKFIEKQIIEHNKKNTEENGIEFDKAVEFYQGFTKLENWINEAACFHVKLWTELLEKDPSADRIIALGTQIMSFTKKLGYQYGNLLK